MTEQFLINNQLWVRLGMFILGLTILGLWETYYTWRMWLMPRWKRWARHLSLVALSQLCIKLAFPVLAVGVALFAQDKKMGVLNQLSLPYFVKMVLGLLALDFSMYWQHRMMHKYHWLWRIHRVHHMDRQLDVTTGVRFHPIEMIISTGVKIAAIGFLGINVLAVIIFEIVLNLSTLFTHVNVRLKPKFDHWLRKGIVTPGMHRIHHSDTPVETNSNYGFCLSLWDRLFNSYTRVAKTGEAKLVLGLEEYHDPKFQTFENMLWAPFNVKHLRLRRKKPRKLQFQSESNLLKPFPKS
jgi:sterol desaturase/sphingolipid hydroxylase (fatty acid hydroxylase superfamily)